MIRVLHLEPDAREAQRIRERLQDEELACEITWVKTLDAFLAAAREQTFDIALSDYELGGLDALRQLRQLRPELPVITLSAGLSEEEAVDCMKAGATDYVLKPRLRRLAFSVRRVVVERQQQAALRSAEEDLRAINAELESRVRQRTAELETTNAFLNSVIQHIPYQVIVKRVSDMTIVRVNRAVEEMTGHSEKELLGTVLREVIGTQEESEFFAAKDREALELGREVDIPEETLHTRSGEVRVLHAKKLPILDETGQPRYLLTMSEDITERRKREREIERLNAALAQRTDEVEAANRAKGTFLATMSHEIRTPMHGMLGMLELLGLSQLDPEQRETLEVVRQSSRSLLRIIDDILDFSKIEAGKLDIHPEVVSIKQVIEEVQSIYLGNASAKGLVVRRMVDPRISPALRVDPVRLRQILNNFVSNAIKFTSAGWIDINVQWLGRADGVESLRFEVKDTGAGISKEDQDRLFQPFTQALVGEARRRASGTGLGLVIARQLAQLMGGAVTLASEPGLGTTITLDLKLPIVEGPVGNGGTHAHGLPATLATRRAAPSVAEAEAEGTLVLLADDHPVNRMLLLRQVATLGYAAQAADDGRQALELWQSGRFALVITDCHMPHMDGYELARAIRQSEAQAGRKRIPIIACTANALQGECDACFAAGMDDFLVKPVELSALVEKLDQWLPLPQQPAVPARPEPARSEIPIDEALLAANCGGDAAMFGEVLAAFRRTCEDDTTGLRLALAANDAAQVSQFAHRMAGASRMVGALGFAAACEPLDRAGRAGDWPAIQAALPAFERESRRLADWFEARKETA
ncbi:response regulator [Ramlibacter sp. G-1-2-2]|uniref:Sensory/regulatory protein RpfC n=1 Tax=Ramlibacter agri TaxID=2728837 RepID=A0A848H3A5_9BURK|nr:response regulator [Ramlibacter agri]NML45054.1 response regulator [Ramlibacter agri]